MFEFLNVLVGHEIFWFVEELVSHEYPFLKQYSLKSCEFVIQSPKCKSKKKNKTKILEGLLFILLYK